jgi:NADPH:quinone reductase-like Zn-dependent oxidoreductase
MQAMKLAAPGGIDQLHLADIEPRAPGMGEIQVEIKATSLNFHDYAVVTGLIPLKRVEYRCQTGQALSRRSERA